MGVRWLGNDMIQSVPCLLMTASGWNFDDRKIFAIFVFFQYLVLSKHTNTASRVSSFKRVPHVKRSNIYPKKETHQLRGDLKFGASSGFGACAPLMLRLN